MTLFDRVRAKLCPPPLSHRKEAGGEEEGEEKKNCVIKQWVMSGSHGWHPPLFLSPPLPNCFHCLSDSVFSSSLPWYFSLSLYSPLSIPQPLKSFLFHSSVALPPLFPLPHIPPPSFLSGSFLSTVSLLFSSFFFTPLCPSCYCFFFCPPLPFPSHTHRHTSTCTIVPRSVLSSSLAMVL